MLFVEAHKKQSAYCKLRVVALCYCIHGLWPARIRRLFVSEIISGETCVFKIVQLLNKKWKCNRIGWNRRIAGIGSQFGVVSASMPHDSVT